MALKLDSTYTTFAGFRKIASGRLSDVIPSIKKHLEKDSKANVLIFDDSTGHQTDIDLRGSAQTILKRLHESEKIQGEKKVGPGRPKLGVISREVTLLPEHWDWLASQPGGASVTLRRLVDSAQKKNHVKDQIRRAQEATYKVMTTMAGDLQDYEEALRSLYAKDQPKFEKLLKSWPSDLQDYLLKLARPTFER